MRLTFLNSLYANSNKLLQVSLTMRRQDDIELVIRDSWLYIIGFKAFQYKRTHPLFMQLVSWKEGGYLPSDRPMPRGEIVIGGPSITAGYFNNQAKTDEVYKVSFLTLAVYVIFIGL